MIQCFLSFFAFFLRQKFFCEVIHWGKMERERERERVEYARQRSSTSHQRIQKRLHMKKLSVKVNNSVVCVSFLVLLKMTYTTHLS